MIFFDDNDDDHNDQIKLHLIDAIKVRLAWTPAVGGATPGHLDHHDYLYNDESGD